MCSQSIYRITQRGQTVAAWEEHGGRTRHVVDLLNLLQTSAQGIAERDLRQFMSLESLLRAITSLQSLGLIESQRGAERERGDAGPARDRTRSP